MGDKNLYIHLGCGDVYLDGYLNCDINGELSPPASSEQNKTTLNTYFKYPFGTPPRSFVIDRKMDALEKWPFNDNSVAKLVTISFIEHFQNIDHIVQEAHRVLQPGAEWIVDFPDIKETVRRYIEIDPEFCMRLIYCNHKNPQSIHHWGYTRETFEKLLRGIGNWRSILRTTIVNHDYPMIGMVATK